jgi:hypothetical protein
MGGNRQDSLPKRSYRIHERDTFRLERTQEEVGRNESQCCCWCWTGRSCSDSQRGRCYRCCSTSRPAARSGVPKLHGFQPTAE